MAGTPMWELHTPEEDSTMELTRHPTPQGARWALDGRALPAGFTLAGLLALPRAHLMALLQEIRPGLQAPADGPLLAPVEPQQEVWGSGVTYLRSRDARRAESAVADVYEQVYRAQRPELFFKAPGWRVVAPGQPVRIRRDAAWNVPEPELTLVLNAYGEIVGYTAGNDMSSRDIEGENPLYLPQAKIYNGSCAVGPAIRLLPEGTLQELTIFLEIFRGTEPVFHGAIGTGQMKRRPSELAQYLFRELDFPQGVLLMTGTGIVPPDEFSLQPGDRVRIGVGDLVLENPVAA